MISVTVVECVSAPLVPVTVTVYVPGTALFLTLKVSVDVPVPPADSVTVGGLNDTVTFEGTPDVDSVTVPLKPFSEVRVMVVEPEDWRGIVRDVGEALIVKSAPGPVTESVYVVLWLMAPEVPTTVMVYEPAGVLRVVPIVNVLVKVGLPLVGLRLVEMVGSAGDTEDVRVTSWVVPLSRETVIVEVVLPPWETEPLEGLALRLKSNPGGVKAPIWLITVFQFWNVELFRYSDSSQNVEDAVGAGSVAAPK